MPFALVMNRTCRFYIVSKFLVYEDCISKWWFAMTESNLDIEINALIIGTCLVCYLNFDSWPL